MGLSQLERPNLRRRHKRDLHQRHRRSEHRYPKPGMPSRYDECPPVYFATALQRFLIHIWNLRIHKPKTDILLHSDDIEAAFHRILYHPDIAIVFAYVFDEFSLSPSGPSSAPATAPLSTAPSWRHELTWLRTQNSFRHQSTTTSPWLGIYNSHHPYPPNNVVVWSPLTLILSTLASP